MIINDTFHQTGSSFPALSAAETVDINLKFLSQEFVDQTKKQNIL